MLTHSSEKSFTCKQCGKRFKSYSGLSYHMKKKHASQTLPSISQQLLTDGSLAVCTTLTYITSSVITTMSTISSTHGSATVTTSKFQDGNCVTSVVEDSEGSEEPGSPDAVLDWINNAGVFSHGDYPNFSSFEAINNKGGDQPLDFNEGTASSNYAIALKI